MYTGDCVGYTFSRPMGPQEDKGEPPNKVLEMALMVHGFRNR